MASSKSGVPFFSVGDLPSIFLFRKDNRGIIKFPPCPTSTIVLRNRNLWVIPLNHRMQHNEMCWNVLKQIVLMKESWGMSVVYNRQRYYRTSEICQAVGVSRTTLWRWIKAGILVDTAKRDRRGWRLFTETDLKTIKSEVQRVK
jgi:hypothetical protein